MKQNDIFEQEFDGRTIRFQLVELKTNLVTIETMDITPPIRRSGNLILAALFKQTLATNINGEYVTTEVGDNWIKRFAAFIYKRVIARNKSLQWLVENGMEQNEAKALIGIFDMALNDWQVGYMLTVVRWAISGEIDPESESDIDRVKDVLSTYFTYLGDKNKDESVTIKYDKFASNGRLTGDLTLFFGLWMKLKRRCGHGQIRLFTLIDGEATMKQKHVKMENDFLTHMVYAQLILLVISLIYIKLHFDFIR